MRAVLTAVAVTAACSEVPTPVAPTNDQLLFSGVPGGQLAAALKRSQPLAYDVVVTRTIGPKGGKIKVEEAGVEVEVEFPEGALKKEQRISVILPKGEYAQVRFEPHGLQFDKPVSVELEIEDTEAAGDAALLSGLQVAYFGDASVLTGVVKALEILNVEVDDEKIRFGISHFSGYCVIGDRCDCN